MSEVATIPLNQLSIDEKVNVRKTGRGSEPEFVGSIEAKGIIEPLQVRKNGTGYKIMNGGKRFAALEWMRDNKKKANGLDVRADYLVPVIVRDENDSSARETSLMTNMVRSDMHPVDEYEAFATLIKEGKTEAYLQAAYHMTPRQVKQVLALAALSPKIREMWRTDQIETDVAEAMTLAGDHKTQDALIERLYKRDGRNLEARDIHGALKIKSDVGKMVEFVGLDAYEKRGGKIARDLFGDQHTVNDEKLLKAMVSESLDERIEQLKKAGWSFAVRSTGNDWDYGRIEPKSRMTQEEKNRINELKAIANSNAADAVTEKAEADAEKLEAEILARSFSSDQMTKSGCILSFGYHGFNIEYGRVKPSEKRKVEAQERAASKPQAKTKDGKKAEPKIGIVSNALMERMSEQLSRAASAAIVRDPELALAALVSGFASGGDTVTVTENGLEQKKRGFGGKKHSNFADTLIKSIKVGRTAQLAVVAAIVSDAIDLSVHSAHKAPLKNKNTLALCEAINGKDFSAAMAKEFDYKDYFSSVNKPTVLKAIEESIGKDEARKVSGKPKGDIEKFAFVNVPKTDWLPVELRTKHYVAPRKK